MDGPDTLPPAKPGESKDPCAFSDFQDLLDRLEESPSLYNTTLLVETCDNICQLIFGTGNPDISGMMISYGIQAATSILFGPLLLIVAIFLDRTKNPLLYFRSQHESSRWANLVLKLTLPTHRVNSFTAACVLISAVIRQSSNPPVFEARFNGILSIYQFYICVVGSASYVAFCPVDSVMQYVLQVILYAMAGICSSVQIEQARQSMKTVLSPEGGISGQIAKDCNVVKGYPPASSFDAMFPQWETSAPAVITLLVFGILALVTIVFVLWREMSPDTYPTSMRCPQHLRQAFVWCSSVWLSLWGDSVVGRIGLGPVLSFCAATIFTSAISFGVIELYRALYASRDELGRYVKDEYQENDWGFGQVLAVAVWVTWLLDAIFLILVSFDNAENAPVEATDLPIRHQISNRQLKANSLLPKIKSRPQELSDRYLITLLTLNWI
ncbi:hypothetical protein CDV36_008723 [Fusarium kuroshium]|uniref:Uncharacterized protein n=1 Tax=Fusarium kuroshium TaxID=2010991 RepID=A0A3M2S273_9HYPO|nr:hypothetical protein CDV36_008723 [Fusarium kuroshium]